MSNTIAAIATPAGRGAIAVVRLSGANALAISQKVLRCRRTLRPRVQTFSQLVDSSGELIDEVLATYFPAPRSYTGEDVVEISCHGGLLVTRSVLECLLDAGATSAMPGEFTQRAFLNGKLDLTQAEAVMDLISAQTSLARRTAMAQLRGGLGREVNRLRDELIDIIAHLEAYIDFPEEDLELATSRQLALRLDALSSQIQALAASADQGRILREGVRTVICGKPNSGKSSLLNRLAGFDRAIVTSHAGTTRDTIEETVNVRGIPLRLIDTAGLREALDPAEREGIARTNRAIADAELVLEVIDGNAPPSGNAPRLQPHPSAVHLRILNKADLGLNPDCLATEEPHVPISCLTGAGLEELKDRILAALFHEDHPHIHPEIAVNARHLHSLRACLDHLREAVSGLQQEGPPELTAVDLRSALCALDSILGKTDVETILGAIFSSFCIGK